MKYFGEGLSEKHRELSDALRGKKTVGEAKKLFYEIHSKLHMPEVYGAGTNGAGANSGNNKSVSSKGANSKYGTKGLGGNGASGFGAGGNDAVCAGGNGASGCGAGGNEVSALLEDLTPFEYAVMPTSKDETIAWAVWHIARIEDLTVGVLVGGSEQIFSQRWQAGMNVAFTDVGNSMTDDEIISFSKSVNHAELLAYRTAVGKRTRDIVGGLGADDMKRGVSPHGLEMIRRERGVIEPDLWLLDYWGKKDMAGLLLMPPTRHLMLHLNDCGKWKREIRAKNKFFRS